VDTEGLGVGGGDIPFDLHRGTPTMTKKEEVK
jgi:hypothetical protein